VSACSKRKKRGLVSKKEKERSRQTNRERISTNEEGTTCLSHTEQLAEVAVKN